MVLLASVSEPMIERASREVGVLWPLDRAVAVNPLVDMVDQNFEVATAALGARLGIDPWPSQEHLDEAARRGFRLRSTGATSASKIQRLPTMFERFVGSDMSHVSASRAIVGQILLESVTADQASTTAFVERARRVIASGSSWVRAPRTLRDATLQLLAHADLNDPRGSLSAWSDAEIEEEMARHFSRLPGWSAWAKWNDLWARTPHRAAVTRRELLTVSFAVDLAWLHVIGAPPPVVPQLTRQSIEQGGPGRLTALESAVHGELLGWLHARSPVTVACPRFQIVTCIDVRSEPLRRALESNSETETFGFAGFFGVFATVHPEGDHEAYESLPVLVAPTESIYGGPSPTVRNSETVAANATLAELTHEPTAMFALAETSGFLGAPWLLARSFLPRFRSTHSAAPGAWQLSADNGVHIAEGALRGMGLTGPFANEVLILGHTARSANNPHFATLECGACAGHSGAPNAAVLVALLNDLEVRHELHKCGIAIPSSTRFVSGEHDTTREVVTVHGPCSNELLSLLKTASDSVAQWRSGDPARRMKSARRLLDRRAQDWSEVRPEWGLADHGAFVVAPRSSLRGVNLKGRSFLHSYDPTADDDGSILASILAAPVVVAQWINAAYYFSSVSPDVLGAGDKTLHNPVGDFAVIQGEDPDLCLGLPWQSLRMGDRPVHLPVRLLVAVEAPLDRITGAVHSSALPRQLVEGEWIRLVGRSNSLDRWHRWVPGRGWSDLDA